MGIRFNTKGVVVIEAGGQMTWDSLVSAHSGKRFTPGGVLDAVPGVEGLFVRLLPFEARQLDQATRDGIHQAAREWYAALRQNTPVAPKMEPIPDLVTDEPEDNPDWAGTVDPEPKHKRRTKGTEVEES